MPKQEKFQAVTADTRRLIEGQEGRSVDFKVDPKGIHAEDLIAFANSGGGTILAGVEEIEGDDSVQAGKVVGCKVDDETRLSIVSKATSCRPSLDVNVRIENARTKSPILRIDIPDGPDKPYGTSSGSYKIRSEGRNVGIDPPLMKAMILESEADEFVRRFRHAADELLGELESMSQRLSTEIKEVRLAAETASYSAQEAATAAQEAIAAAEYAASIAEDAAMGGY